MLPGGGLKCFPNTSFRVTQAGASAQPARPAPSNDHPAASDAPFGVMRSCVTATARLGSASAQLADGRTASSTSRPGDQMASAGGCLSSRFTAAQCDERLVDGSCLSSTSSKKSSTGAAATKNAADTVAGITADTVADTAGNYGLAPIAASTHPFSGWQRQIGNATTYSPRTYRRWSVDS